MSEERLCKDCYHHRSGASPKCEIELPFWAEPHGRPAVYDYDGDGCTAFLGKHEGSTKDATIERLTKAREPLAAITETDRVQRLALGADIDHWSADGFGVTLGDLRRARAALDAKP